MPRKIKSLTQKQPSPKSAPDERRLTLVDCPESDEFEIHKKSADSRRTKKIRFPKEYKDQVQLPPEKFVQVQNAIDEFNQEKRQIEVYADSLESHLGYDSLLRVLGKFYGHRVAYYRSESGGSMSLEDARKEVYRRSITDTQATELLDQILRLPSEFVSFRDLLELNDYSPSVAQNIWEMLKRQAAHEFESGHRAAAAFEPLDYMMDAWNRASFIGLRDSLIEEWQPKGGIELSMIDAIAQAWLMLQYWTEQSVRRTRSDPRRENYEFVKWKEWNKQANPKQWHDGQWDLPTLTEDEAIEQAARMADRWQRMYFRAIRSLRDWRRYAPQVTINNPQQVNIANDGGQQINVSKTE